MAEIQQALDSDMLTENPMATLNAQDATRFKNDHMKGLLSHQRYEALGGDDDGGEKVGGAGAFPVSRPSGLRTGPDNSTVFLIRIATRPKGN